MEMEFPSKHWTQSAWAGLHGDTTAGGGENGFFQSCLNRILTQLRRRGLPEAPIEGPAQGFDTTGRNRPLKRDGGIPPRNRDAGACNKIPDTPIAN